MPFSSGPCITALRPKSSGSCGPRRSGLLAMFLLLVKSSNGHSLPTQRVNKFGWPPSRSKLKMVSLMSRENSSCVHGLSPTRNGYVPPSLRGHTAYPDDPLQIWMKSAVFEQQQGQIDTALETLAAAIKKYPKFAKLYMIQGQIHQDRKNHAAARASFATGIKQCSKEVTLWILASRLEEADGKSIKSRALLDKARLANPGSDVLWAEAVGVEERSGGAAQAKTVLARGRLDAVTFVCRMLMMFRTQAYRSVRAPVFCGP